ncbi:MAG: hypothetical protein R3F20_05390 [Planctomycetota bacterium]
MSRARLFFLLAALGLWLIPAAGRTLWLDELHSLHHATRSDLGAMIRGIRDDAHPPLSFVMARAALAIGGDSDLVLRLPSLLGGLATALLLAGVSRRLRLGAGPLVALAASSYALLVFSEARAYGCLAAAVAGAAFEILRTDGGPRPARLAIWIAAGLLLHYAFVVYLVALATVATFVAPRESRRAAWRGLVIGGLAAAPWYVYRLVTAQPVDIEAAGGQGKLATAVELFPRLFAADLSLCPAWMRTAALVAMVPLLVAAVGGLRRLWARDRRTAIAALVLAAVVPIALLLIAWAMPRRFNPRYLAGALPFAALVVGAAFASPARLVRGAAGVALAVFAAVTVQLAFSPGREDRSAAVDHVIEILRPGDALLVGSTVQPDRSVTTTGFDRYLDRAGGEARLQGVRPARLADLEAAEGAARVVVFVRGTYQDDALAALAGRRERLSSRSFGPDLRVLVFGALR